MLVNSETADRYESMEWFYNTANEVIRSQLNPEFKKTLRQSDQIKIGKNFYLFHVGWNERTGTPIYEAGGIGTENEHLSLYIGKKNTKITIDLGDQFAILKNENSKNLQAEAIAETLENQMLAKKENDKIRTDRFLRNQPLPKKRASE